jgi:hypothetical protein
MGGDSRRIHHLSAPTLAFAIVEGPRDVYPVTVEDWSEVEKCLTRCLWTEKMQNRYCLSFWNEVKRCRESFEEAMELDITNQAGGSLQTSANSSPIRRPQPRDRRGETPCARAGRLTPLTPRFAEHQNFYLSPHKNNHVLYSSRNIKDIKNRRTGN